VVRLTEFLDLFRPKKQNEEFFFKVNTRNNIPIATGLASSASGFASIVKALNVFFGWNLNNKELSVLARLGSGSAARSFEDGFVEWNSGKDLDGMDSYAVKIADKWPDLQITPIILADKKKKISSRVAMQHVVETSPFYELWPKVVENDLSNIKKAIENKDFSTLGRISEHNACAMHALTLSARDPLHYYSPETISIINKIWDLRKSGVEIYFTQDAGPNIILLYLKKDFNVVNNSLL
jgi:diphosphomevalonate decarboxylase